MSSTSIVDIGVRKTTSTKDLPFTKIDKILADYRARGLDYADWQKERYPVSIPKNRKGRFV